MVRTRHVVMAVILHVVVLGTLFVGFRCTRKLAPPPPMQATLISSKPAAPAAPPAPAPPKVDEQKVREEQKRVEEEKKAREVEEQKKAREVEEQKKAEQVEQQRRLDEQKKAEQVKKQAAEDARRKKEEDARKQKEEAAKREADRKKQEQKEREEQLLAGIQSEEKQRKTAATASAQAAWIQAIRERVIPRFNPPPGASDNFQCRVHVSLLPGGQIVDVKLMESCGNPMLDDSVERAIRKSDPLPTPEDPAAFERELDFTFVPHL